MIPYNRRRAAAASAGTRFKRRNPGLLCDWTVCSYERMVEATIRLAHGGQPIPAAIDRHRKHTPASHHPFSVHQHVQTAFFVKSFVCGV